MNSFNHRYLTLLFFPLLFLFACKKEFLEKKSSTDIVVPTTLSDMMQLLDNENIFRNSSPGLGILSGDEYYYPSLEAFNATYSKTERNAFLWKADIYEGETKIADWNAPCQCIFYANVVLDEWEKLASSDKSSTQGKYVKACALFSRSYSFYNLVQVFSPAYNKTIADQDLGVPLKLSGDINVIAQRSSVEATYQQIINDLKSSIDLYPETFPEDNLSRSSRTAAYALLSRVYLNMHDYSNALQNANMSLATRSQLMDYNTLDRSAFGAFTKFNSELIYSNIAVPAYVPLAVGYSYSTIAPTLIGLYEENDLRKEIFFKKRGDDFLMKPMYTGDETYYPFTGLAVDEIFLIKAECLARNGQYSDSMDVLNSLLLKRYKVDPITNKSSYVNQVASSSEEALQKVLLERRKELVWRGLRWSDLKRLNAEGANITLSRSLAGKVYTLPPNDPRYVMPIPSDEVQLSHIQQNIR